jgi:hypothetical protein
MARAERDDDGPMPRRSLHSKALNMLLGMAALYGVAMRPRGWSNPRCICHMGLPYKVRIALRAHATS